MYVKKYSKYSRIFEWSKHCLWNIECENIDYFHLFASKYPIGAVSLAGASVSRVTAALTSKYQKKLSQVTKLVDIITSPIAVFEMSVSKALNTCEIDEQDFNIL